MELEVQPGDPVIDPSQVCRICLSALEGPESTDIFAATFATDKLSLHDMLRKICAPVFDKTVEEDLEILQMSKMPHTVCVLCQKRIVAAYQLYEQCIESDRKLWEIVAVKQEPGDPLEDEEDVKIKVESLPEVFSEGEEPDNDKDFGDGSNYSDEMPKKKPVKSLSESFFHCEKCTRDFQNKNNFDEHMVGHQTGMFYKCSICDKRFKTRFQLTGHKKTHSKNQYFCPTCGIFVDTKQHYNTHLLRHSGVKEFACKHCPARFPTKTAERTHQSMHSKEKAYICDICGTRFNRKCSVKRHKLRYHSDTPRLQCSLCDKSFIDPSTLRFHMMTHTGVKPHRCPYCGRSFTQSGDLTKHTPLFWNSIELLQSQKLFRATIEAGFLLRLKRDFSDMKLEMFWSHEKTD